MSFNLKIKSSPQINLKTHGDCSLLETLRQAGIEVPTSCENGICATCKGKIYEGKIAYPDIQPSGLMPNEEANGEALFCCAFPESDCVIDHPDLLMPGEFPARFFKVNLSQSHAINNHVMSYQFKIEGPMIFKFLAGQYIELIIGTARYPLSLVSSPKDTELEVHVIHSDTTQENKLISSLNNLNQNPERLMVYGPKGRAYWRNNLPGDIVFLAGGGGITPMLSMIPEALKTNSNSKNSIYLYWGAKTKNLIYAQDLMKKYQAEHSNFHFIPVLSEEGPDKKFVHEVLFTDIHQFSQPSVFMAGPPAMIKTAQEGLINLGISPENIFGDGIS